MQQRAVAFWLLLVASGCANDDAAVRPAQDPDDVSRVDSGAPAPVAEAPVSSAVPAAQPNDPPGSNAAADCGPARPNPHGVALEGMTRRDGSCKVCETVPAPLPACTAAQRGVELTTKALDAQRGKRVSFAGTVSVSNARCTRRGGPCVCNNQCSGALQLSPAGVEAAPIVTLTSKGEPLACVGDEGGLCCPFAMGEGQRSLAVVVSGTLAPRGDEGYDPGYQLEAETICAK